MYRFISFHFLYQLRILIQSYTLLFEETIHRLLHLLENKTKQKNIVLNALRIPVLMFSVHVHVHYKTIHEIMYIVYMQLYYGIWIFRTQYAFNS
jgi:hypothetical protein